MDPQGAVGSEEWSVGMGYVPFSPVEGSGDGVGPSPENNLNFSLEMAAC